MTKKRKTFHLWVPLLLLGINIIFLVFIIEELIDASPPNYGGLGFLMPVIGLISFTYIRNYAKEKPVLLIWILQGLNWFFIFFPVVILIVFILAFI
ncbi:hypothetical protein FH966_04355 [Lentibacillus cibarius]|uniref:Uncharacterized protein n=1 Tax=Lentibacillus cibarius TaxID=2583219 RepID=A0A549YGN4_9BACI|nr:hypothetical protein [Lentibacillus cibarius]TMN22245.1 hypothetical protein FFL34_08955 [Lentibacillus cibarius]TRM11018.1 hypothetical protein FH966_04355 [Lentibacillus cibarius]